MKKKVHFYSIAKRYNHFLNPQLIAKYTIQTPDVMYAAHGMCCLEFDIINSQGEKAKAKQFYKLKILLFGNFNSGKFFESFLSLDINIDENYYTFSNMVNTSILEIDERLIDFEIGINNNNNNNDRWINIVPNEKQFFQRFGFGYQCLFNSKKEAIILIIGGCYHDPDDPLITISVNQSVIACNITTKKLQCKKKV